jgi:hypothetical protein
MSITITVEGAFQHAKVSNTPLKNGTHRYDLDSKDPLTAFQLQALVDAGIIKGLDVVLPKEFIKEVGDALNEGTLVAKTEKKFGRKGTMKNVPSEVIYKGSKIPEKVKKDAGSTGPATKAAKKPRKNNN